MRERERGGRVREKEDERGRERKRERRRAKSGGAEAREPSMNHPISVALNNCRKRQTWTETGVHYKMVMNKPIYECTYLPHL